MAEYQYRIITPTGKEKRGTMEAKFPEQAKALLKADGNIVLEIEEAGILSKDIHISFGSGIVARDYSIFCRQFASIINAGVSVLLALEMLAKQTENKKLREGILGIKEDVSKGESLTAAMRKRGKVFPSILCNIVEAGEASGGLDIAFDTMATHFEKENKLKTAVGKAMMYPVMLVLVMIAVLVIMLVFVIPRFMTMFSELGAEMPAMTRMIVSMSQFVIENGFLILIIGIAGVTVLQFCASTPSGKFFMDGLGLKIPVFGKVQKKAACARFARTLHTLMTAGVSMLDAIEITARSMENLQYKQVLLDAREQIRRGVSLSKPLQMSGLFPPMVIHMLSIGEETGNLEGMLENLANYYEDDVQSATEQMMVLLEPMIIVVMAGIVGFMVISILQPMFTLYESIG
ncbi:MAG: type II secretion system F family protein [Lachnospiraceae bacterium]|nr:type II secretion system F family protein [Lachnospiraceae bacterium]